MRPWPLVIVRASESDSRRCRSVAGGKSGPEFGLDRGFEFWLIVFDDQQVIPLVLDNLLAQVALAKHRVARDQPPFEHDGFQQIEGRFGFVGRGIDRLLAQHAAEGLVE